MQISSVVADNTPASLVNQRRSFLRLPVPIDVSRLVTEYHALPEDIWGMSHWDNHPSVDVLLLRGGKGQGADDFTAERVSNNPVLVDFPYISQLIGPDGPFGGARYGFIFRMRPNGVSRIHRDNNAAWERTLRIHIPIITNDGAYLLAEGRSKHLPVGEVWTFNNQDKHSAINGNAMRVHMIIDVEPNPRLTTLMAQADFDPGRPDAERWAITGQNPTTRGSAAPSLFAVGAPLSIQEKRSLSLMPAGLATRITGVGGRAALLGIPLQKGDVVTAVDGVEVSDRSRSALDHVLMHHRPGQRIQLDILRSGERMSFSIKLHSRDFFRPHIRIAHLFGWRDGRTAR